VIGDTAITLVAPTVTGTLVDSEHPYVAHGPWLQVLIPDDLAQVMSDNFEVLNNAGEVSECCEFLIAVSLDDRYFSWCCWNCRCYLAKLDVNMIVK
jgi:hypothetical protein